MVNLSSTDDIYIDSLEEKIQKELDKSKEKILKNKKIFKIKKEKQEVSSLCLRNEAELVQQYLSNVSLPTYQELKQEMFSKCELNSFHFYKTFCKKVIGKENNYVFNIREDYLNDMTKIDKDFFAEYYKIAHCQIDRERGIENIESVTKRELVYDFAIYHPLKNVKTQQISIKGSCFLHELKDKIYCVLDEIHSIIIFNSR